MCVELIKNIVQKEFKLQLKRKTRRREYVEARAMYYKLLREKNKMSFSDIARTLDKNHATILHAISGLNDWIETDTNIKSIYNTLEQKVQDIKTKYPEKFSEFKTEKELYEVALEEMQEKHNELQVRYNYLLGHLKKYNEKTYKRFKNLETNTI
jgi:trans-aconitate methyltransferase